MKHTQDKISRRISEQVSQHTSELRKKMEKAADFQEDYQKIFGDFADKKLGRDDLYYSIKTEIDSKTKVATKEKKKKEKGPQESLLPPVYDDASR